MRGYTKNREGAGILRVKRVRLPIGCAKAVCGAVYLVGGMRGGWWPRMLFEGCNAKGGGTCGPAPFDYASVRFYEQRS